MSGNAPEYQYNEEYFTRNKKARSSWVSTFLLGLAPAPLPTSFEEAVEKCIINDHTRYLPRDSNIVLDAFDLSNQDVVRNWHICLPNNHANVRIGSPSHYQGVGKVGGTQVDIQSEEKSSSDCMTIYN